MRKDIYIYQTYYRLVFSSRYREEIHLILPLNPAAQSTFWAAWKKVCDSFFFLVFKVWILNLKMVHC